MARFPIKGFKKNSGPDDPDIEVEVDDDAHEAYSKGSVPEAGEYKVGKETITITWFANFGVRQKAKKEGDQPGPDANIQYRVKLKKLAAGKRLFALYKDDDNVERVHELSTSDAGSGFVQFTLSVGDPPIGSGP